MTSPPRSACSARCTPRPGIDWPYFENTAKQEGLKVARTVDYTAATQGTAPENYQEQAPVLVAKLKDSGVTTVLLFADFPMHQQVFKAADSLDYHPEWVFTGYMNSDLETTARPLDAASPEQMKHVFGIGSVPPYVAGIDDPIERWFDWYWGKHQGVYQVIPVGALAVLHDGVSLAGPKLTPARFQQALFSMPAGGGAASNQVEGFMGGFGRTTGLPYDEYSQGGLDYTVIWWNPTAVGKEQALLPRRHRPVHVHRRRQALPRRSVEERRAEAVRPVELHRAVRRVARVGRGARLPLQRLSEHQELNAGGDRFEGELSPLVASSLRPDRVSRSHTRRFRRRSWWRRVPTVR